MSGDAGDDPKRWRRRAITLPLTFVVAALVVCLAPLLGVVALVDAIRGSRLAWTRALACIAWLVLCEAVGLAAAGALGLVRPLLGEARFVAANYALQRGWGAALMAGIVRIFAMRLVVDGDEAARAGPFLLLVRHVSTGDAILPLVCVAWRHGLRPRYVLKAELRWDPCLDVVGARVPNAYLRRGRGRSEIERSAALAQGLGPRDFVVLYPEGTRFSPRRRERRLADLEARGDPLLARAQSMTHTIPPRTGAALGVLGRAEALDVVFLAHVGLERVRTLADLFSGAAIGRTLAVQLRRVDAASIPSEDGARRAWLFDQWAEVDAWVAAHSEG
ncbi:MAG: 1-acyl-sn-glycerol-3-phosphate acyltransferase [Nannocystaceae bacterium]